MRNVTSLPTALFNVTAKFVAFTDVSLSVPDKCSGSPIYTTFTKLSVMICASSSTAFSLDKVERGEARIPETSDIATPIRELP
jgi:hypothetical protein